MNELISKLNNVDAGYQPIPFWSWNDRLDTAELLRQIRWMKDNGIGGFFMHARGGLKTPYLEKEWMDAIEVCCEEGRALGMHPWAYDENGWPSGFAGGKLLEDPANRDMYLTRTVGDFDPAADVSYRIGRKYLTRVSSGNGKGKYLNVSIRRAASTADILNPDVVKKFLQLTHEQYKARLGEDFAEKTAGFFTDEPQYYRAATPYTPMLEGFFREHYGMDILDGLGLLFMEKDGFRTFRYRYYLALQTLMLNSFAKQIYGWCEENGVRLTGHYVEEPTMGGQMMCCAGVMPFYEYEHIPGIDWLGSQTGNEVSPRQLNSAARQLGKTQALTETFGCCGWNISPADLKRVAGFQYACGVNLMCHHLLPYSEHGQRKKDYPAHFNAINPWIHDHFKDFNDFFSRLGYLLSGSDEPVNVAMLHPMRSAYFHYQRGTDPNAIPLSELDEDLQKACRTLSGKGIGYHFLDETLLEKHGFVRGATIGCGNCGYTYLVLPKMLTMGRHTERLLRQFVENGGKILLLDGKPAYLEGEPFDYSYLAGNTGWEEILSAQPMTVEKEDTQLYCTYRVYEGRPFLFVQNASPDTGYTQTFRLGENVRSFTALDLVTMQTRQLPLTVRLEKNESLLLFPAAEAVPQSQTRETVTLRFTEAEARFGNNFLTLNTVRYSKDGSAYSEPILCSDLCQLLLEQRYEGDIWLRYEFDVRYLPDTLRLLAEKSDSTCHRLNGQDIIFDRTLPEEPCVVIADISPCLREGRNCYETALHWHQSEATYYALFGEGVTESLRNCIAYDSEIEPVYLAGHFGVYADDPFEDFGQSHLLGSGFYIGQPPKRISETVTDGLPFFRGELTLTQTFMLDNPHVSLALAGDYLTARVTVNGRDAGVLCFQSTLDISPWAKKGENEITAVFTVGNRNLLGPFHTKDAELFVGPHSFIPNDLPGSTENAPRYKFRRFYR